MVQLEQCPRVRLTYKGKYLSKDGEPGLICGKDHAHEREHVDNSCEPVKHRFKLAARALRLAKRLSKEVCWTLWNPSTLATDIQDRVRRLKVVDRYTNACPCGKSKCCRTTFVRVDAAQLFKSASVSRGLRRTQKFLERFQSCSGKKAVAVLKAQRSAGFLTNSLGKSNRTHTHFF